MSGTILSSSFASVALLTEGVDRNIDNYLWQVLNILSPSSRRAWIEITTISRAAYRIRVALLTEGVDRNSESGEKERKQYGRPPHGGRG